MDDAATAAVAALGVESGVYNVVDDEPLRFREYAEAVGQALVASSANVAGEARLGGALARRSGIAPRGEPTLPAPPPVGRRRAPSARQQLPAVVREIVGLLAAA